MVFMAHFIHRSSYFITEGGDVVKHDYPWLVIPNKLLLIHVPRSGFQDNLLRIFLGVKDLLVCSTLMCRLDIF